MHLFVSRLLQRGATKDSRIFNCSKKAIEQVKVWDTQSWKNYSDRIKKEKYKYVSLPSHYLFNQEKYKRFYGESFMFTRLSMLPEDFFKAYERGDIRMKNSHPVENNNTYYSNSFPSFEFNLMSENMDRCCGPNSAYYAVKYSLYGLEPKKEEDVELWRSEQYLTGEDYIAERIRFDKEEEREVYFTRKDC